MAAKSTKRKLLKTDSVLFLRVTGALRATLDEEMRRVQEANPCVRITFAAFLRSLLQEGLRARNAAGSPKQPEGKVLLG